LSGGFCAELAYTDTSQITVIIIAVDFWLDFAVIRALRVPVTYGTDTRLL
jgi:hypothetical protein